MENIYKEHVDKILVESYKSGIELAYDDINFKTDGIIGFYVKGGSSSYLIEYNANRCIFSIVIKSPVYSSENDKYFEFQSFDGCLTCIKALDAFYQNIITTTKYF